jgi:copper transport protein
LLWGWECRLFERLVELCKQKRKSLSRAEVRIKRRIIWPVVIVLLYSAWAVTTVSAHALLMRSNPAANAVLETPPVQVEIFFSEPLEPQLSSISVIDSDGLKVDAGDVRVDTSDPHRMTVTLHPLAEGVYTVSWKALSSIDGHQSVGTFPFAVGNVNATAVSRLQQTSTASLPFIALISKFLLLASLAILVGQRLFIALVWDPALKSNPNEISKPAVWTGLYRVGLIGVLLAIGLGILSQAGQTTGSELSLPWDIETGHILTATRLGVLWLLRLALAMLAVWLAGIKESPVRDWLGFAVNLVLLFTVTLTSHAATEARPILPVLGDWLHLAGMTFWLGGLVYLFTGIRQLQQMDSQLSTRSTSLLTSRFSINAIIFVSLIGLTGFYSAYLRVGSWPALLTSLYGHVLLIKQVFVGALLIIAATNLLVISPRLNRERLQGLADTALVQRFGRILVLDIIFASLLLASVSFLTYIPPAKIVSPISDFTEIKDVDDIKVEINISPAHVGLNTFMLMLISYDGKPITSAKEVVLRFTSSQPNIPPSELELISDGEMFSAKGAHLSFPGKWQVQAVVRRQDKFDTYANFDVTLRKPGDSNNTASSRQVGGLILSIGLLVTLLTITLKANRLTRFGLGIPLTLLTISLGFFYLTRPPSVENAQANPIPPNSDSIATGGSLFVTNCVPCHGVSGKGDGPVGLTLNPRPADLRQHAIPGVHTDAQLFEWISDGFPGSRMPAFRSVLSDTDRWNLVNFIRTLAPK